MLTCRLLAARCVRLIGLALWIALAVASLPLLSHAETSRTVEVIATIEPELSLSVEPATGERIDLGTVYSSLTEPRSSDAVRVNVSVFSNLDRPYHVTQELVEPMTNETGARMPAGSLLVGDGSGAALSAAADRPQIVLADQHGDPADGQVAYQLRVPPKQDAGTYRGTVLMTVTAQ